MTQSVFHGGPFDGLRREARYADRYVVFPHVQAPDGTWRNEYYELCGYEADLNIHYQWMPEGRPSDA